MNKNISYYFLKSILWLVLCSLVGTLLLFAVYTLPTNQMYQHVKSSTSFYQKGGEHPTWAINLNSTKLDNFTDSTMLLSAIHPVNSIAKDAMTVPSVRYKGSSPTQSLIKYMTVKSESNVREYAHYWHGYLIILKPLLLMFPLSYIRLLNMYTQLLLAFYLFYLFYNEFGCKYTVVFFLSYLVLNPISLILSFQYSTMFYISFLSVISLLKMRNKLQKYNIGYLFLFLGIITSFFDFLTYPLLSLSFPLLTLLLLLRQQIKIISIRSIIEIISLNSVFWGLGYVGMFVSKWAIATLITGNNLFFKGIGAASTRMSSHLNNGQTVTALDAIARNIKVILQDPSFIIFLTGIFAFVFLGYKLKNHVINENTKALCIGFASIAILPIIWFSVFFNHSYIHHWFTYRNVAVTIFSLGCLFLILHEEYQKEAIGILKTEVKGTCEK